MTILKDPVRSFDPSPQLKLRETEQEAGAHTTRPAPPLRHLGGRPLPRPSIQAPEPRPGDAVLAAMRPRGSRGKTSFELASPGGYLRKVTGSIAYLDEEADTYMVLARGELVRVPLRDITARHEELAVGEIDRSSYADAEGLGTGS
jgi:hypothetical protein